MKGFLKNRMAVRARKIDYGPSKEKQLSIPDQAMSIRTIIDRYVRGVPVDVKHRQPVYVDQSDYDLEKLSRAEFSEKMSIAEELRERYDQLMSEARSMTEAKLKEDDELREADQIAPERSEKGPQNEAKA